MPRDFRYTTEQARDLFNKYGYMPADNFEFIGINRTYRVLDEVNIIMVRRSGVAEPPHPVLTGFSLSGPVPTNTLKVPHIRKDFPSNSLYRIPLTGA